MDGGLDSGPATQQDCWEALKGCLAYVSVGFQVIFMENHARVIDQLFFAFSACLNSTSRLIDY